MLLYDAVNNAESNYKAVINRDPRYTSVWYHLGDLYKLIGYNEKASNAYLTALEYDKQLPLVQFETVFVSLLVYGLYCLFCCVKNKKRIE